MIAERCKGSGEVFRPTIEARERELRDTGRRRCLACGHDVGVLMPAVTARVFQLVEHDVAGVPFAASFEQRSDPGGLRHYLGGRAVHAGQPLELLMQDGTWLAGRYETRHGRDDDGPYLVPLFYIVVRCRTADREDIEPDAPIAHPQASFQLPRDAVLRWPAPTATR